MGDTVGAVVLAAGQSERFESGNKLLASVDGRPIVGHAAETVRASTVDSIVAVVGYEADRIRETLPGVETVRNEQYSEGQSTSVATGVVAARERGWDATLFMLGDMPFVDPASVDTVVAAYRDGDGTVCAPAWEGQRGNPALFDWRHYEALADVTGDTGGRSLVVEYGTLVAVDDPGVRRDIDRRTDLDGDGSRK